MAVLALVLVLGAAQTASAAKPPRCTDVPISVTFMATTSAPAAIWNDVANTAYQNGVGGVAAVIHYNSGCDGTRDATLDLGGSTRTLSMQFPNAISGSTSVQAGPASFAGGSAFATHAFFNVHNIVGYQTPGITPGVAATFYTKVTAPFTGPNGKSYKLVLYPDNYSCPFVPCASDPDGTNPDINLPVEGAWALVTYTPRDTWQPWSLSNADRWVVDGEVTSSTDPIYERGTLVLIGKNGSATHEGQYSMPFKILVTALAPLP